MEVIRALNTSSEIIIKGTAEEPLYRAWDIGQVLYICEIREVIRDYDDTERVILKNSILGVEHYVTYLTEKGLFKLLLKSNHAIAKTFQNSVCEVIIELRKSGHVSASFLCQTSKI